MHYYALSNPFSEKKNDAHFVFVWMKTFRKVNSQFSCNSEGFGQPISQMWIAGVFFGINLYIAKSSDIQCYDYDILDLEGLQLAMNVRFFSNLFQNVYFCCTIPLH